MTRERAVEMVFDELARAEKIFPDWPDDPVHGAAIVGEEAGELIKAALDRYYGRSQNDDELVKEAIQTAAMGFRFLLWLVDAKSGAQASSHTHVEGEKTG